ncbi:hypothetical protein HOP50_04g29450 [Chloropicon primus]|uniref:Uncharacterized protein n=2 Tax=Chloropicon primus TaxID=1764295 RepID=A0A5B8MIG4_9CHLO|nr:hypothetical protein A3770_04p29460 [Chloropicon primus]UPQ99637.1 hypothetical protein HOP50_04g29450 [Chloropicon primus]|eukprot:QDZ20428.1 hypothetical protein A3770_04p29460 [Chloropicon primus]
MSEPQGSDADENKPSGFSVVTDSLSQTRLEHFDRKINFKLPSLGKGAENENGGDAEDSEGILFSGLSYNKLPDLGVGIGQPSKQQSYVKASFTSVVPTPERGRPPLEESKVRNVQEVETEARQPPQATPTSSSESGEGVREGEAQTPAAVTPEIIAPGRTREDMFATPGKPLDCDYYFDNMDLDGLLSRLEQNKVSQDLLSPSLAGGKGPDKVSKTRQEEGEAEQGGEVAASPGTKGAAQEGEPDVPKPSSGGDEPVKVPEASRAIPASAAMEEAEQVELDSIDIAVVSHPIMDLWDEDDINDESTEEWLFLSQKWTPQDLGNVARTLSGKKFQLEKVFNLKIPSGFYAMAGERGVMLKLTKPEASSDSLSTKSILHDLNSTFNLPYHVFHNSDQMEELVSSGIRHRRRMSATKLSALRLDGKKNGFSQNVSESQSRDFACVALSPDLKSIARALESLCCSPVLPKEKVVDGDFEMLSLVAISSCTKAISQQDRNSLMMGTGSKLLSPLRRDRIRSNREHRLENGVVFVLLFGMNAASHCLHCLEEGKEEILGLVPKLSTTYFATKHFGRDEMLQDPRATGSLKPSMGMVPGLPVERTRCAIDLKLSESIYFESFLRSLTRQGFSLCDVGMSTATSLGDGKQISDSPKMVLTVEKADGRRNMQYCVHNALRINPTSGVWCPASTNPPLEDWIEKDRRIDPAGLRDQIMKEKATCLILGPFDNDERAGEKGQIFQDLSEISKFSRKNGFRLTALWSIDSGNAKVFKQVEGQVQEAALGKAKPNKRMFVMVLLTREMAVVKMQLLGGVKKCKHPEWIPKTKEEVFEAVRLFKCCL